jgi:phenylalanyl-tRNA synthetase beta chain
VARVLGLRGSVYVFELSVDKLRAVRGKINFKAIHTTPSIVRDLTVDLPVGVEHADVSVCIKQRSGKNLKMLDLVNLFELDKEHRSLTYRLTFQDPEETLTNEEINQKLELVRKSLAKEFAAGFRLVAEGGDR